MKKSMSILGSMAIIMGAGYGAWRYYKNQNPKMVKKMEKNIKKISKNVEDNIEEMM